MNARQQFASDTSELAEQSLGSIAVNLPGATAVFRAAKLDFCCHGNVSLRQAAQDKNLDLNAVVAQLANFGPHLLTLDIGTWILDRCEQRTGVHQPQASCEATVLVHGQPVRNVKRPRLPIPDGLPGAERIEQTKERLLDHIRGIVVLHAEGADETEQGLTVRPFEVGHGPARRPRTFAHGRARHLSIHESHRVARDQHRFADAVEPRNAQTRSPSKIRTVNTERWLSMAASRLVVTRRGLWLRSGGAEVADQRAAA